MLHRFRLLEILPNKIHEKWVFYEVDINILVLEQHILIELAHKLEVEISIPISASLVRLTEEIQFSDLPFVLVEVLKTHMQQIQISRINLFQLFQEVFCDFDILGLIDGENRPPFNDEIKFHGVEFCQSVLLGTSDV